MNDFLKVVFSLCVLLFTYDAICGEKEAGTLRLYASFPVSRSRLALAKLCGSTVAVLLPMMLSCLLVSAAMAFHPQLDLSGDDWARMAVLLGVFGLYLVVFAAFGLCVSALTTRRMSAFLALLGLWTAWLFVVPNAALRAAQNLVPVQSVNALQRQSLGLRWRTIQGSKEEVDVLRPILGI